MAIFWLKKAAEQNHAVAQYNLGICYYEGSDDQIGRASCRERV